MQGTDARYKTLPVPGALHPQPAHYREERS